MRSKSDLIDVKQSSIFCGVAGTSPATTSYEQSDAIWKSIWHLEKPGLNDKLFRSSAITSKTVGGLRTTSKQVLAMINKQEESTQRFCQVVLTYYCNYVQLIVEAIGYLLL